MKILNDGTYGKTGHIKIGAVVLNLQLFIKTITDKNRNRQVVEIVNVSNETCNSKCIS